MEVLTKSAEETKKLGREMAVDIGKRLRVKGKSKATILALSGELGSGKTTFVQGLADGLGIKHGIISPTFILLRKYIIHNTKYEIRNLYHLDLYRLEENIDQEVRNLGIEEIWKEPKNIVVIEWAEKIKDMMPKGAIWVKFENLGRDRRRIESNLTK